MSSKLVFKLKDFIEEHDFSVQGLEKKAGVKIHAVRNILTGQTKKPSAETVYAVSKALKCTVEELLGEAPPEQPPLKKGKEVEFQDLELLEHVLSFVLDFFKHNPLPLMGQGFLEAVQQIYIYSTKNNDGSFDAKFAEWFLERKNESL